MSTSTIPLPIAVLSLSLFQLPPAGNNKSKTQSEKGKSLLLFLASKFFGLTYFWKSIFVQQNQSSHPCDTGAAHPAAGTAVP